MRFRYLLIMVQAGMLWCASGLGSARVGAQEPPSRYDRKDASEPSAVPAAPSGKTTASPAANAGNPQASPKAAAGKPQASPEAEAGKEVVEVKPVGTAEEETIYSMELRHVDLRDLLRLLAHNYHLNIAIDKDVTGEVTASFERVTLREALDTLLSLHGYRIEQHGNIMQVTKNLVTQLFVLNSVEARTLLESGGAGAAAAGAGAEAGGGATGGSANTIFDLLSPDGKILLGQQPNSLMVVDHIENIRMITEYLGMVDRNMVNKVFKLKYIQASTLLGLAAPVESDTTSSSSTTTSTGTGSGTSSGSTALTGTN